MQCHHLKSVEKPLLSEMSTQTGPLSRRCQITSTPHHSLHLNGEYYYWGYGPEIESYMQETREIGRHIKRQLKTSKNLLPQLQQLGAITWARQEKIGTQISPLSENLANIQDKIKNFEVKGGNSGSCLCNVSEFDIEHRSFIVKTSNWFGSPVDRLILDIGSKRSTELIQ